MDQSFPIAQSETAAPLALTPMMAQYFEIKAVNPGFLLFYRMGDFYELFFEDAEIASQALGIVLTKRGKHLGQDIAMCGVPIHAAQDYLKKLISLGHRVAICEQVEDPAEAKKRGAKSVVKRDVVRLVTRGTLTEDDLLPAKAANYIAALAMLHHGETAFALAWSDISTGECFSIELSAEALGDELARIEPAELVLTEPTRTTIEARRLLPPSLADAVTVVDGALFDSEEGAKRIRAAFPEGNVDPTAFPRGSRAALGCLIAYVEDTQKGRTIAFRPPLSERTSAHLAIDAATRTSLELLQTQGGERKGSLLDVIDSCITSGGSRLLARRLAAPLCDPDAIRSRLDMVSSLIEASIETQKTRETLRGAPDLTRALTRLSLERGGPRDLLAIARGIAAAQKLAGHLATIADLPPGLATLAKTLSDAPTDLAEHLLAAIDDEPPLLPRHGGFVRKGFDQQLDAERLLASETREVVAALQSRLVEETGIKALKIRHNGVLGYFVEVPPAHGSKILEEPLKASFIHRQTLANAMRFTTSELAALEGRIAHAHDAAVTLETNLFATLCDAVLLETDRLRHTADALAELDVTAGLAHLAAQRAWCRPEVDASLAFDIRNGRHPVVEQTVRTRGESFIANSSDLSGSEDLGGGALWLVTGPNMGGKSTFLRQNALIAILAQIGSYVPADSAHIGIVDRVFSRVGASDDIAGGRSTFMVEMVETAAILNRSTRRSLVILDEIGRGTATFDGLSIAWATVEALHDSTGCRALFATHFHELTALAKSLSRVSNHTMKVREWEGEVVFLHEVGKGAADRSYGIQVARLAGLPEPVLRRARAVLTSLEQRSSGTRPLVLDDLPLFAHSPPKEPAAPDPVHQKLDATRPDEMTPRQALELLYELKTIRDTARRR